MDQLLQVMAAFRDAELGGRADQLEKLLAEDFLSIGEQGYLLDKVQWISRHGDFRYHTLEMTDVDIRYYDRTAIVRAVQHSAATWQGSAMELRNPLRRRRGAEPAASPDQRQKRSFLGVFGTERCGRRRADRSVRRSART